jgi:hypothetical protein
MIIDNLGLKYLALFFAVIGAVIGFVLFAFRLAPLWAVPAGALALPAAIAIIVLILAAIDAIENKVS